MDRLVYGVLLPVPFSSWVAQFLLQNWCLLFSIVHLRLLEMRALKFVLVRPHQYEILCYNIIYRHREKYFLIRSRVTGMIRRVPAFTCGRRGFSVSRPDRALSWPVVRARLSRYGVRYLLLAGIACGRWQGRAKGKLTSVERSGSYPAMWVH